MSALEALLRRERAVVASGLVVLTALAWIYVWRGAGMGMSAIDMTRLTLFPHLGTSAADAMPLPGVSWLTVAAMWWVMMIAMMIPSAAPLVLLYGRVLRHSHPRPGDSSDTPPCSALVASTFVVAGYLSVWLAFSLLAAALQYLLARTGLIATMLLSSRSEALSAAVLLAAGVYQLSPLKSSCLTHCRSPVAFLTRHWRGGPSGALILGLEHGAWCVSCCWMLMMLLFVGGVMNLAWIAVLSTLVLVEKLARTGVVVGRLVGTLLIAWGVATVFV